MTAEALRSRLVRALEHDGRPSSDFDLNPEVQPPAGHILRPAAVLIAVSADGAVTLTKRSSALKHHPGQVAFPGGKVDATDAGAVDAALREAREEVGLPTAIVDVLGCLPSHRTVTGFDVVPVLAMVRQPFRPVPEAGEVAEVFSVPLSHLTDPGAFSIQSRIWRGKERSYYTVPWGPYYIWGATARILRALAERMAG